MFEESDDEKEKLQILATMIAVYTNPHMYPFDALFTLPEKERLAELQALKDMMKEMIG
jgi:hypothetical protein